MKKALICLVLLGIILSSLTYWHIIRTDTLTSMLDTIDTISENVMKEDYDNALAITKNMESDFKTKEKVWKVFVDHEFSNDLDGHIAELKTCITFKDKLRTMLAIDRLRNHIEEFYDNNRLTLTNIL